MASSYFSSLSSRSIASSSSRSCKYDVFLSFRGIDTRKNFVDHLYSALEQQGIFTYKDDETLLRGESINPSLLKAIKESHIAVIVFSKNYANSFWCLDELAYIMECKDERGQTVLPIFYDLSPSEMRKQSEEFRKAFAKQESQNNSRVESWRKALVEAANLAGWEPKNIANGHEAKCIKEIVNDISRRLDSLVSSGNEDLIGMETRMQDLLSQLKMDSHDARMVGIWGIGGGGKSTLAYSVYKKIYHDFDGCCFVENIREESSKFGLKRLQEKVLLDVLKSKQVVVRSIEEGKDMIKSKLRHRSVLIVLDDVDHLDHLTMLAGSHNWFGDGSRIIITTRNQHLLKIHKVDEIYNVSLLNNDESMELFVRHAFQEDRPKQGYEMLSLDVVAKTGGLPLALTILGSFLFDKDLSEWMSALARLNEIPDTEIVEKLKISYDGLRPEEKELFLDIACFFKGTSKWEAMRMLDACGFHPMIGVKVLIQKALITISDGSFDMHDLVQEMGHHIVQGEDPNNLEKHSRVWQEEKLLNVYNGDATMENENIEAIHVLHDICPPQHLIKVVANMKKLRLLYVDNFNVEKPAKGPEFLSNELRWIHWRAYPASSLPTAFQATKLDGLDLQYGLQKRLWKGYKHLPNLKVLNLSFSKLKRTPNINGLPCLDTMWLLHCLDLEVIHQSLGCHKRLVYLDLHGCVKLKVFPPIIQLKRLETLLLSNCHRLKVLEIRTKMDSLLTLCLNGSGIKVVPSSIGQYCTNLVSLDLRDCFQVKSIESNFQLLQRLKVLNLSCCKQLEKLPEDLFDVKFCLEELSLPPKRQLHSSKHLIMKLFKNLMGRRGLQFFPMEVVVWKFSDLPCFLRKLDLKCCKLVDEDITSYICELYNLQVLDLSGNNFSRLHSSLSKLHQLKFLNISNCTKLVDLPELPSSIAILIADDCDSLGVDGEFPTKFEWLWKVSLLRKENKQGVIDGDKILQSMLQGKAIESHFLSLFLAAHEIPKVLLPSMVQGDTFTLQLPQNWFNDFSGFLMCVVLWTKTKFPLLKITIQHQAGEKDALMGMDSRFKNSMGWPNEDDDLFYPAMKVFYVSFSSWSHTTWWNSACNTIFFRIDNYFYTSFL